MFMYIELLLTFPTNYQPEHMLLLLHSICKCNVIFLLRTDNDARDQMMPGKFKSGMDLSFEEKAEMRVEQGMERNAELSVEKSVEDAINQKYAASLAAVNIEEVQEVKAVVDNVIPPPVQVQASVGILPVPVPVPIQPMPEPVQKKKQLTPEQLRAIEIAAEMSVEKQAEMNVEHAAERAVENKYFASAEAGAKSMTEINPVVREVARQKTIQPTVPVAVVAAAVSEAVINPVAKVPDDKVGKTSVEVKNTAAARTVETPKAVSTPTRIILDPKATLLARKQPKSVQEETMLQAKYGSMDPGGRAFAILLDLGMIISHQDPDSPGYDSTFDNDIVPSGELV